MKILLVLLLMFTNQLFAYTIVIFTDQADHTKANEIVSLFQTTYPFDQYEIEFQIYDISSFILGCRPDAEIARLPRCNTSTISSLAANAGADQSMIIWDNDKWGGAGGSIPIITKIMPPRVMIHEYMHGFGFSDEYVYEPAEAKRFCQLQCPEGTSTKIAQNLATTAKNNTTRPVSTNSDIICQGKQKITGLEPNLAYIHPYESYLNDTSARSKHYKAIKWMDKLSSTTKITHDNDTKLGSGSVSGETPVSTTREVANFGLYRAQTCDNADPKLPTWSPSSRFTIMKRNALGLGPEYESLVNDHLARIGIPLRAVAEPTPERSTSDGAATINQ